MSLHNTNNSKDQSNSPIVETDIPSEVNSNKIAQELITPNQKQNQQTKEETKSALPLEPKMQDSSYVTLDNQKKPEQEFIEIEQKSQNPSGEKSILQQLKAKTIAVLVGSAIMLPILTVGTATYYFGSQAIDKQLILAKRIDNIGLAEKELLRHQMEDTVV